jgi:hypothetical protein
MYTNYKGIDMYCDPTNDRRGRYKLRAKIGGLEIEAYTDKNWSRRVAYDLLMEEACKRFIGALVTYNADPFLVEHDELALDVIKAIDKHYANTVVELTPDDDEEFVDACERLDLDPEANDVKRVLYYPPTNSAPGILICMSYDWEIA